MKLATKTMVLKIHSQDYPSYYFFEANEEEAEFSKDKLEAWYQQKKKDFYLNMEDKKTRTQFKNNLCLYEVDCLWWEYLESIQKDAPKFIDFDFIPQDFENVCLASLYSLEKHIKENSISQLLKGYIIE